MMNKKLVAMGLIAALCASAGAWSAENGAKHSALLKALPTATVTLQQGLAAANIQGQPISAKFEVEDGHLQLSVYTTKGGSYSEVIVDHMTGKVSKTEAITEGEDLAEAKAQSAAVGKASGTLAMAVDKAEQASPGFRAVGVTARVRQKHAVASVEMVKGKQFKAVTESLE